MCVLTKKIKPFVNNVRKRWLQIIAGGEEVQGYSTQESVRKSH